LSKVTKRGRLALLTALVLVSIMATGCYGQASMQNPGWTALTASDGVVYAALSTGQVTALSSQEGGAEIWLYPASGGQKSPVGCGLPLSPKDDSGESPLDAVYGLPVLSDGRLVLASYDHHLYAFDRETGERTLTYPATESTLVDGPVIGGVTVDSDVAYFGSSDHKVYALDLTSSDLVWDAPFETDDWVWGTPVLDAARVYIGSMDHSVYALDRSSGALEWSRDMGASVLGGVALADGKVFVGTIDRHLYALDAETGEQLWQSEQYDGWLWGTPLAADGRVFFGSLDGAVHAVDASDGSAIWSQTVDGAVRAGVVAHDDTLIAATDTGKVYVIGMEAGDSEEALAADGQVLSSPAVDSDGTVYVGTAEGKVYALDLERRGDPTLWVYPPDKK